MATPFLPFMPVRDSYTVVPGYNTVEVRLDGGKSRRRRDQLGAVHVITPTWILNKTEYTKFMGFFRENIEDGTLQFRASLLSEQSFVLLHVVTLIGGMPKLIQQAGDAYFVSAILEVTPNPCRSYLVQFNVDDAGPLYQVIDNGTFLSAGDMSEFPVGRSVQLTGTRQTDAGWGGVYIDLDGVYVIDSYAAVNKLNLLNAPAVNADWTVLNGLTPDSTAIGTGACILLPL